MWSRLRYGWGIEGPCTRDDKDTFFCKKGPHHRSTLYHLGGLHNVRTTPTATATLLYEFSRYALDLGESRDLLTANVSTAPKIAGWRPVAVEDPCLLCGSPRQSGGWCTHGRSAQIHASTFLTVHPHDRCWAFHVQEAAGSAKSHVCQRVHSRLGWRATKTSVHVSVNFIA